MTRTALPVAVLAPVLLLAACSDGDGGASTATTAAPASTPAGTAAPSSAVPTAPAVLQDLPSFAVGPNGVIADVTTEVCDAGPGSVTASGTATNSGRYQRDVVVVVSWVAAETSDVVARAVARVEDVPPGQTRDWSLSTEVPDGDGLLCVPTAYAGQLAAP